jgi:hypothetical protein
MALLSLDPRTVFGMQNWIQVQENLSKFTNKPDLQHFKKVFVTMLDRIVSHYLPVHKEYISCKNSTFSDGEV